MGSEVEKLYSLAGVEADYDYFTFFDDKVHKIGRTMHLCKEELKHWLENYQKDYVAIEVIRVDKVYPPFTAEKQLDIENVILQNKKNYNKWIEYNINVYGEWVIRFVRTDKFAPYIALGKTRAEAFANVVNHFWQDLTEENKQQIKEILE